MIHADIVRPEVKTVKQDLEIFMAYTNSTTAPASTHDHSHADGHDHHDHGPGSWTRIFTTTNHKDIGSMYLWFSLFMFFAGGSMALLMRVELFQPGLQVIQPELYNSLTTVHALIMIFGAVMPAFTGFANWLIPMQIGAADMAFPRMNNWSFWLMIPAGQLLPAGRFIRRSRFRQVWAWI
jgi:cytochrome c oxidase subunit I